MLSIRYIFKSPIKKKSANLAVGVRGACAAKFSTSKNHRDLKNTFLLLQRTTFGVYLHFYLSNNLRNNLFFRYYLKNKKMFAHFGQTFLRPCAKLISNISKTNFGFGVLKLFSTTWQVPNFFLQKSLYPRAHVLNQIVDLARAHVLNQI